MQSAEKIDAVRDFLKVNETDEGSTLELQNYHWFLGAVAGLSTVYGQPNYEHAVCYPQESTSGQVAEIAAKYIIDHPEERADRIAFLVWKAHAKAFKFQVAQDCWMHDQWLEYNS